MSASAGGVPKRALLEGYLGEGGFDGDSWRHPKFHGGPKQAALLISMEVLDELREQGFAVYPGALGENITTEGIDYARLRIGHRLRVGEAIVELTKLRVPCDAISVYGEGIQKELFDRRCKAGDVSSPRWGRGGFYARVIQPGTVRPQDIISVETVAPSTGDAS